MSDKLQSLGLLRHQARRLRQAIRVPLHALAVTIVLTALLILPGMTARLNLAIADAWFDAVNAVPTGQIVVVDIAKLARSRGDGLRISRTLLADLLQRLDASGSERVLIELSLQGETTPADDAALDGALDQLGKARVAVTTFAILASDRAGSSHWRRTEVSERFMHRATLVASDLAFDPDNRLRRYGVATPELPNLITAASWLSGVPTSTLTARPIDFGIDARRIPLIDAMDVLDGGVDVTTLRASRIIVTSFASALGNEIRVPRYGTLRRAEITALATETLLRGRELHSPSWLSRILLVLCFAAVATFWSSRLGFVAGSAVAAGLSLCLFALAASEITSDGLLLPIVEPLLAIVIGHVVAQASRNPVLCRMRDAMIGWAGRFDARLARALDETGEALVTFTAEGNVLSMNDAAKRLLGAASYVRGAQLTDLIGVHADGLVEAAKQSQPGRLIATVDGSSGVHRHFDLTVNTMPSDTSTWIGIAAIRDVTEQQAQIETLRRMASQDCLTGLANRLRFEEELERSCSELPSSQGGDTPHDCLAVLLCDLDGFKKVNDTLGHQAGDLLLRKVADRIRSSFDPHSIVARLGGDEFAVILSGSSLTEVEILQQAQALITSVVEPILIDDDPVTVGISVGIALSPSMGSTSSDLVKIADAAMYRAKRTRDGVALGLAGSFPLQRNVRF